MTSIGVANRFDSANTIDCKHAQLAIRLTKKTSSVKFYEQPENLGLFEEPMECLGRGRLAIHTPVAVSKDVVLPIELANGNRARVVWPDYGGEQVQEMFRSRTMSRDWSERASTAEGWLAVATSMLNGAGLECSGLFFV